MLYPEQYAHLVAKAEAEGYVVTEAKLENHRANYLFLKHPDGVRFLEVDAAINRVADELTVQLIENRAEFRIDIPKHEFITACRQRINEGCTIESLKLLVPGEKGRATIAVISWSDGTNDIATSIDNHHGDPWYQAVPLDALAVGTRENASRYHARNTYNVLRPHANNTFLVT